MCKSYKSLKEHYNWTHKKGRKPINCCGYLFFREDKYQIHLQSLRHKKREGLITLLKSSTASDYKPRLQKSNKVYLCECCNYKTRHSPNYKRHLNSSIHKRSNKYVTYSCEKCNFFSVDLTKYKRHCNTRKHLKSSQ